MTNEKWVDGGSWREKDAVKALNNGGQLVAAGLRRYEWLKIKEKIAFLYTAEGPVLRVARQRGSRGGK